MIVAAQNRQTYFRRMLNSVFSFEVSSEDLSDVYAPGIEMTGASVEVAEVVVDGAGEILSLFADGSGCNEEEFMVY